MDPYKTNRLNAALQRTLSELLETKVKDPRVGFVTVSSVELNRDHSVAKVYFSVLGQSDGACDDVARENTLKGLKKAGGFLQSQVARILELRATPELRFVPDASLDRSEAVEAVLKDLAERGEFRSEAERRRSRTLTDFVPPRELVEPLRAAQSVWITPHFNPDPDAVGSTLALGEALRRLGKDVTVLRFADPPLGISWLPGWKHGLDVSAAPERFAEEPPDLGVLVDCHRTDRLGPLQETFDRLTRVVCVDHHLVTGRRAPAPGWVDDRAEACVTLVHQVIMALHEGGDDPITLGMATNLFAGLVGDTGGFRFENTTPMTFGFARDLAARGIDTAQTSHRVMHQRRRAGLELLQRCLGTCVWTAGGKVVTARASLATLAETHAAASETEGFVNVLTSVDGVQYAAFLKETAPDVWRASLRAMADGDVQSIAARYGGGGHRRAAGCTIEGEGDAVAAEVAAALADLLPARR
jgi:phosphoesterase RecJ-like protein